MDGRIFRCVVCSKPKVGQNLKLFTIWQSRGASAFSYWESMAKPVESAIDTSAVKMLEDNEPLVIKEAGEILLKLIGNVLRDPHNMKYRSVRLSNPKIESKLLVATGAFEILFSVGFEEDTDSLLLPLDASLTKLRAVKTALEKIMWGRGGEVPNPGEDQQRQLQEQKQSTKGNAEAVVMQSVSSTCQTAETGKRCRIGQHHVATWNLYLFMVLCAFTHDLSANNLTAIGSRILREA